MRALVPIGVAIKLLELLLCGRMTEEERRNTEAALSDLRMAKDNPLFRARMQRKRPHWSEEVERLR